MRSVPALFPFHRCGNEAKSRKVKLRCPRLATEWRGVGRIRTGSFGPRVWALCWCYCALHQSLPLLIIMYFLVGRKWEECLWSSVRLFLSCDKIDGVKMSKANLELEGRVYLILSFLVCFAPCLILNETWLKKKMQEVGSYRRRKNNKEETGEKKLSYRHACCKNLQSFLKKACRFGSLLQAERENRSITKILSVHKN